MIFFFDWDVKWKKGMGILYSSEDLRFQLYKQGLK